MEGRFPRAFERRDFFLFREIFTRNLICTKRPCKWAALSIGPCWGNCRGSFTGTFERKRECISGFQYTKTGETNCNAKITE